MTTVSWGQWLEPAPQDVLFLNLVFLSGLNPGFAHFKGILTQVLLSARFLSLPHTTFLLHPLPPTPLSLETLRTYYFTWLSAASHIALKCILVQLRILPECHCFMSLVIYKWIILQDSLLSFSPLSSKNEKYLLSSFYSFLQLQL